MGKSKRPSIMMIGDDGSVYKVDPGTAKKVPQEKLSNDVKAHIKENVESGATGPGGVAHIFVSSEADIFTTNKADIFVANKADIFTTNKADIFTSAKADIFFAGGKKDT